MKSKISLIVAALIFILPIALYTIFKTPALNGALNAADGKPIVLEFSTPLCSECQKLKLVLAKVEPLYASRISFQKINANTVDPEVFEKVKKYNVRVVPTTVFIDKQGQIVATREGSMSENTFENYLKELLK